MPDLRIAIAGLGAIGAVVARRLDAGIPGLALTAVATREPAKAAALKGQPVVAPFADLPAYADVVVEAAPAAVFRQIAQPAIASGRLFMPLSVGALLSHLDLVDLARQTGARILPPTGALLGLDAVRAAAEGTIHSVRMVTRKPPAGLKGAPHLEANAISLDGLDAPLKVFEGSAREAAIGFPANVNVAAALSLAGIGPDRTMVEVWADPTVTRNTHRIEVDADSTRFSMLIEGVPSPDNPRTGMLTPLSVIAALRGLVEPLKVGT